MFKEAFDLQLGGCRGYEHMSIGYVSHLRQPLTLIITVRRLLMYTEPSLLCYKPAATRLVISNAISN